MKKKLMKIHHFSKNLFFNIKKQALIFIDFLKRIHTKEAWMDLLIPENPSEHEKLVRFLFFTLGLVFTAIALIFLISFSIVKLGKPIIRIPDVEHKNIMDSVKILNSENLKINLEMRYCDKFEPYTVIKQIPAPKMISRQGRTVTLVISLGKDLYIVPSLCGLTKENALKILEEQHIPFSIQTVSETDSNENTVLALDKHPNSKVSRDIPLILTINAQTDNTQYSLDDFTRHPLEFAATILINNRITPIIITTNVSSISDDGLILEQNIPPGELILKNSSIILTAGLYTSDSAEREHLKWYIFSCRIPKNNTASTQDSETNINEDNTQEFENLPTAKVYKAVLEDDLGRSRIIYERSGGEGSLIVRIFKAYGQASVTLYENEQPIGKKQYGH
ncbi:MAG: PASTA domain-containing protein [Brevinemataceae bacterium]